MLELKYDLLCEMTGDLEDPQVIGQTPKGVRMIYPIQKGTIRGPRINGEVLGFGADWLLLRADGAGELDVRATIKTDDGELIYAYYRGILHISPEVMERTQNGEKVDPSEYYFRTTPVFETGSEKYGWLNRVICVGIGKTEPKRVCYTIYQIL